MRGLKIDAIVKIQQYEIHKELNRKSKSTKKKRRGVVNEKRFFSYVVKHMNEKTNID